MGFMIEWKKVNLHIERTAIIMYIYFDQKETDVTAIAAQYPVTCVADIDEIPEGALVLHYQPGMVSLECGNLEMHGDLTTMLPRLKRLNTEMLIKAAKPGNFPKGALAIDATAGMGEDSLLLAAAGFRVKLFEYNAVIAALLQDSLQRAAAIPELADIVARMEVVPGDSIRGIRELEEHADVIYLDPMFPERQKSGLIKKKFQLLQQLERPCDDENGLLTAAMEAKPSKLIIKRPLKGPQLAGVMPGYTVKGKAIRYDCFAF